MGQTIEEFLISNQKFFFVAACLFVISPWCSAPLALLIGLLIALLSGHPFAKSNYKISTALLKVSIIGIGFGINLKQALEIGGLGITFTVVSVLGTIILGYIIGKFLKIDNKLSYLISTGSAICGGSAIAAVSPIIKVDQKQISVALGTVFILNAAALFIFPMIGNLLNLTQLQFGFWSAIAIHDTSSVVGSAAVYGEDALITAATVKLGRTLWIIPAVFVSSFIYKGNSSKSSFPYFILFFFLAMVLTSFIPYISSISTHIVFIAKKGFSLTLFLIGAGLSKDILRSVGVKPFLQGIVLWIIISILSLIFIMKFV